MINAIIGSFERKNFLLDNKNVGEISENNNFLKKNNEIKND
jgi:hypothetical protein